MGDRGSEPDIDTDLLSGGVGLSDAGLSNERRKLLDLVNRLHSTGVQIDMDLPMIAVVGVQSAGKSSLIEAISGVTLPRSSGTCTRCPTECRLSYSVEPWKCAVSLRFITDQVGQPLGEVRNVSFGEPIRDKADVEDRVRRAQHAVLNPGNSSSSYLNGNLEAEERGLTFSQNCICLAISGPDVADLSFCDLPGLIATAGQGGDANDVELVRSLVSSYLRKPSCVILSTVACETDFEIQGAHDLAKKLDPHGVRTVGVLTKPDRIPQGEEHRWLDFVKGERERLTNGWYCVKQPDSRSLRDGLTWTGARKQENDFFMTAPWNSLPPAYQTHLRTKNLTSRLSTILSELIASRLPGIHEDLYNLIEANDQDLRQLPKAPSTDVLGEILEIVNGFSRALSRRLEGTPEENGLLQKIRPAHSKFKRAIRATAPEFSPVAKGDADLPLPMPDFILHEEDIKPQSSPNKAFTPFDNTRIIYVEDVLERAEKARTRELPDNYPFVVQREYISGFVKQWRTPTLELFDSIYAVLKEDVEAIIQEHFAHIGRGSLFHTIMVTVKDHLDRRAETTRKNIMWLLDLEKSPNTLNFHYYSDYKEKFLTFYRGIRSDANGEDVAERLRSCQNGKPTLYGPAVAKALAGLSEIGINGLQASDLARLLPADPKEPALIIMAGVRAYFQVSYKRFADLVPMAIDHDLVLGLEDGLQKALLEDIHVSGPDAQERCRSFLREESTIKSKREDLQRTRERLNAAKDELRRLGF